jgi:ribosomal protein S18 acetylase RimI-like enzyme
MTVSFHPMTIDDYDDVLALWGQCEGIWLHPQAGDGREDIARYLERNPGLSLAARVDGALAGAVLCGHDGRRGSLNHLAVAPIFRGRGIGLALVESCLAGLAAQGIARCNILVVAENEAGRQFWRHLGWDERGGLVSMQHTTGETP